MCIWERVIMWPYSNTKLNSGCGKSWDLYQPVTNIVPTLSKPSWFVSNNLENIHFLRLWVNAMGLDHLTTKLLRPCNVCMQNQINILLFWNMHAIGGEGRGGMQKQPTRTSKMNFWSDDSSHVHSAFTLKANENNFKIV